MSKDFGASDEDLIRRSEEDKSEGKVSFFDNTIDESENDHTVDPSMKTDMENKNPKLKPEDSMSSQDESKDKDVFAKTNKSFMEIEVKRDKLRWMYMSELGGIFGEEKHTREGFLKLFGNRVSNRCSQSW